MVMSMTDASSVMTSTTSSAEPLEMRDEHTRQAHLMAVVVGKALMYEATWSGYFYAHANSSMVEL